MILRYTKVGHRFIAALQQSRFNVHDQNIARSVVLDGFTWHCDYFVRRLDLASEIDLSRLVEALKSQNKWHQGLFGRLPVWAVRCADFAAVAKELIAVHPHALIREGR